MSTQHKKGKWWLREYLNRLQWNFEAGGGNDALAECVRVCGEIRRPLPDWATVALVTQLGSRDRRNSPATPPTHFACENCGELTARRAKHQRYCKPACWRESNLPPRGEKVPTITKSAERWMTNHPGEKPRLNGRSA
jgi:hypothetical protein